MFYWAAFLLGFAGSLHCLGMCGPLALALPVPGGSRARFAAGRLLYNFGRVITYSLLGIVFGLVGKTFALTGLQQFVSIAIGSAILAGLAFKPMLVQGLPAPRFISKPVTALKARLSRLMKNSSLSSLFIFGLLNGLLPCGLVYIALGGAAVTGSAVNGAAYMAVFGLGTAPMMLAASLSGKFVQGGLRLKLQKLIPWMLFLLAVLFILRGMSLGIPYISPDLAPSEGQMPCCH